MSENVAIPKPKYRSLAICAEDALETPYLISGKLTLKPGSEELEIDFSDPNNFAVGVGNISLIASMNYEQVNGVSIDTRVSQILWVFWALCKTVNPGMDSSAVPNITTDEYNRIITPMGPMAGSWEKNVAELCAYVLSLYGRIKSKNVNGTFEYEKTDEFELLTKLNHKALVTPFEDGNYPFLEIFELSGLYKADEVKEQLKDDGEKGLTDDELKNSQ